MITNVFILNRTDLLYMWNWSLLSLSSTTTACLLFLISMTVDPTKPVPQTRRGWIVGIELMVLNELR